MIHKIEIKVNFFHMNQRDYFFIIFNNTKKKT